MDNDGVVNILDAIRILKIAAGTDPQPVTDVDFCKTDLNFSSSVNVQDIMLAMRKIFADRTSPSAGR